MLSCCLDLRSATPKTEASLRVRVETLKQKQSALLEARRRRRRRGYRGPKISEHLVDMRWNRRCRGDGAVGGKTREFLKPNRECGPEGSEREEDLPGARFVTIS